MHVNPILEDGGHVAHFVAFITDASPHIRAATKSMAKCCAWRLSVT